MNDYIKLIKDLIDKYNRYSYYRARYSKIAEGNPFEVPQWMESRIDTYTALKETMESIITTHTLQIARRGYMVENATKEAEVTACYGCMGEYQEQFFYHILILRRCDSATTNNT